MSLTLEIKICTKMDDLLGLYLVQCVSITIERIVQISKDCSLTWGPIRPYLSIVPLDYIGMHHIIAFSAAYFQFMTISHGTFCLRLCCGSLPRMWLAVQFVKQGLWLSTWSTRTSLANRRCGAEG